MYPILKMALDKDVHDPDGTCFAGPVYAFQHGEGVSNGKTRHVYCYCQLSGVCALSPVPRETRGFLQKWRARLIESRREV